MLIGDDVFIRGIRRGVEQSEYVYRRDTLLYGAGDPHTTIAIDEQAVVFTMAYAKEHGIWPRPKPNTDPALTGSVAGPDTASGNAPGSLFPPGGAPGGGGGTFSDPLSGSPTGTLGGDAGGAPASGPARFSAEGVLREALIRLWEQARTRGVARIGLISIRMFDAADAFRLLGVVAAVRGADRKRAFISGEYETTSGSMVGVTFEGTPQDAQPLKDFLEPQLRASADKNMQARFELGFTDGLPVEGDGVDKLTEQLTRFATGAAYVEATAEAQA